MLIVVLFMFAFGISTQSLMYFNQSVDDQLLKSIFFPAYFIIGGEYYTRDDIMNAEFCNATTQTCPDYIGSEFTITEYVFYLIFLDILLVNLLIAIFG